MISKKDISKYGSVLYNIVNVVILLWFATGYHDFGYKDMRFWIILIWITGDLLYHKIAIDISAVLLFAGMYFYVKIYTGYFSVPDEWIWQTALCPGFAYIWGKRIAQGRQFKISKEVWIELVLWILVLGMLMRGLLNAKIWLENPPGSNRRWADIWTGAVLPATQHVLYFLPFLSLIAVIACLKWWWSVPILVVTGGCLWFQYISGSRTPFGVCLGVLIVEWLLLIGFEWKKRKKRIVLIASLLVIIAVAIEALLIYSYRYGRFADTDLYYFLFVRGGGIFQNVRLIAQRLVIQQMPVYTTGGKLMDLGGLNYAHNVWLDMYNTAGVVPFALFTAYTLYSLVDVIRLCFCKSTSARLKVMLTGLWLCFILYYSVEPALDANAMYLTYFCFVTGLIHYELGRQKRLLRGIF